MSIMHVGLLELDSDVGKLIAATDDTMVDMLKATADVMVPETQNKAETMLQGEYYKGDIKKSVRMGRIKKNKDGKYANIIFYGKVHDKKHPHGERLARIAYINEYGKKNQPARPFIRMAVYDGSPKALEAASEVYGEYLKKYNL